MSSKAGISYLVLYNAHNGESVKVPKPVRFHTINSFKEFINETFMEDRSIDMLDIFLLTSYGMKVSFNIIDEINEVYVFDKRLFVEHESDVLLMHLRKVPVSDKEIRRFSPSPLVNQDLHRVKELSQLLKINDAWTKNLYSGVLVVFEDIRYYVKAINIMFMSLNIIFQFAANFFTSIDKSFKSFYGKLDELEKKTLHKTWKNHYEKLRNFPVITFERSKESISLVDSLNRERLEKDAKFISEIFPKVTKNYNSILQGVNIIKGEMSKVNDFIKELRDESIAKFKDDKSHSNYIKEIQELRNQLCDDIADISTNASISVDQIYRNHQKTLAPQLYDAAISLYDAWEKLKEFHASLCLKSLHVYRRIANLQKLMVTVRESLSDFSSLHSHMEISSNKDNNSDLLNKIKNLEQHLSLTVDLPLLFGFMIIEKRREFEWHEFYSKGIVGNVSEQLSIIISNERFFRKIWIKKFGGLLALINNVDLKEAARLTMPSVDVTLVNGGFDNQSLLFRIVKNIEVSRSDIGLYITLLEAYCSKYPTPGNQNFYRMLHSNFQDLKKSTNFLKNITKSICLLSNSNTSELPESKIILEAKNLYKSREEKLKIENSPSGSCDIEIDDKLVAGLKLRIRKLENLLHQQQFSNMKDWPVLGLNGFNASFLHEKAPPSIGTDTGVANSSKDSNLEISEIKSYLPNNENRRNEGERKSSIGDSAPLERKHSSTTNSAMAPDLKPQPEVLELESKYSDELDKLRHELEEKDMKIDKISQENLEFKERILEKDSQIECLIRDQKDNKRINENLKKEIEELKSSNMESRRIVDKSKEEITTLQDELTDERNMKKELISNLSLKEAEIISERKALGDEIDKLKSKIEECTEDYENLMEHTQTEHKDTTATIFKFMRIAFNLLTNLKVLVKLHYETFVEFCLILESMGLLLVEEKDSGDKRSYRITRVKGLKLKKDGQDPATLEESRRTEELPDTFSNMSSVPISKVARLVERTLDWAKDLDKYEDDNSDFYIENYQIPDSASTCKTSPGSDSNTDSSHNLMNKKLNDQEHKLTDIYDNVFGSPNSSESRFNEFLYSITRTNFEHYDNDVEIRGFFLNAISKRFKDVEGFAKKLTKENKTISKELEKLQAKFAFKITINSFEMGDLVLFLPTRIDETNTTFQPWAAFNIGAPHFFLRLHVDGEEEPTMELTNVLEGRDWLVGVVLSITEHKVTKENYALSSENIFKLNEGITWYVIDAKERSYSFK